MAERILTRIRRRSLYFTKHAMNKTVVGFVEKKLGVALVPETMKRTGAKNVVYIPIRKSTVFSEIHCLWSKKHPLDKVEPFVATFEEEISSIVKQEN